MAALRAGKACAEGHFIAFFAFHGGNDGDAICQANGGLKGFSQSLLQIFTYLEAVNYHFNSVFAFLVERRCFIEFMDSAIDARPYKALSAQLVDQRQVFALAFTHDWREQHQLAAFRHSQHLVHHLADGLCGQRQVVIGAHGDAHAGKKQAQVVVNLGNGADGRTWVVRG